MNRSPFAPATQRARINKTLLSALALSLLAAACSAPQPTATPMPPTRQIPDTPQPATPSPLPPRPNVKFEPQPAGVVAPIVVQRLPEAGQRLRPDGAIELTFDRAMDQDSVATALKLQPAVQGAITWKNARTLSFTPAQALPRDTIIDIALTQEAKATDGAALAEPYLFRLTTQGFLEVGQTIPAHEAPEVQPDTIITVLFNKPVVPLTTLSQQDKLPNPVSFDPPLEGKAEWLNTSVLVFRPSKPLAGGTTYTGIVSGDLKDADGNPVQNAFRWTFSTVSPKVVSVTPGGIPDPKAPSRVFVEPGNADGRVRADTAITVRFNQPIDAASARAAFSLRGPNDAAIDGSFSVISETLTFTPSQRLSFDTAFTARVAAGVIGASGGLAGKDAFEWKFTTVPLPAIVETTPRDGEPAAEPYTAFVIRFNTDIDPATVMPHLTMTPALSPALVYTYFNSYDHTFVLNFNAQPDTDYEVRIDAGITDPYGNVIDEPRNVTFHTRNADPYGSLALPYGGATLNAYAPARVVAQTMNVARLDFELYRLNDTPEALARRYYNNGIPANATLVRRFSQQPRGEKNRQTRTLVTLNDKNQGVLPPGAYVLRMTSPELASQNFAQVAAIFVSEINLVLKSESGQAFVWASDLKDGAPVRDLNIDAYEYIDRGDRVEVRPIGAAATDASGVARIARDRGVRSAGNAYNYSQIFAVARGARFATVFSEWQGGASPYDFGFGSLPFYGGESPVRGHVYTERAIYRAGQKVFARGVLRNQDDFSYSLPKDLKVTVTVRDAEGNTALMQPAVLDAFGAFALEVPLAAGAPLGAYSIDVQASTAEGVLLGNAYANFTVAAYRAPEFEVIVTPGVSETVRGATVETVIRASYLSGGALRGAQVRWNVLARNATFSPPQLDRYSFVDYDNPWRCFDCWWNSDSTPPAQPLLSGTGVTDQNGELKLTLPISTELRDSGGELISGPVSLSLEANVTGADDQVLAGRAQIMTHPALHYVGVAFDRYVIESKKPVTAELIAVDWQGARLSGKRIDATITRREWRSKFIAAADGIGGRWESEIDDVIVKTESVTTDVNGEARVGFSAPEAGTYKIAIRSSDADARVTSAARFVWATGEEYVSWLREDNDRINLIANKTTFEQGETAEILIPSPFIDAQHSAHYALVTVERGHILSYEVVRITNSSTVYKLPIADNHTPNVFVSVVLINSPAAPTEAPDQKFGLIALRVTPRKQTLNITLTPERKLLQPGEDVTFTLRATDVSGAPVQGSFSVDLVDKGVLNLMPRQADAIVGAFYGLAGLSVGTSSGLSVSANRISDAELERQQLGRGGGGAMAADAAGAPAPTEAPAPAAKSEASAARSRADGNAAPAVQVRENFADTAFWRGDISTDARGNATVSLKLPDNLTTWVMRAVGVDAQTRVGEGLADIVATKPLLIRPVTPRFLVVGDEIELSAIINNNTDQALTATASLHVSGITLTTPAELPVTLPANGETLVRWTAQTSDAPQADLVFLVQNEQFSDASKPRLSTAPDGGLIINRWSAPEVVGTAGDLTGAQTRTEVIAVPPGLDTTQGAVTVRLDPSLAASMQDGLKYLEHFPYECAEQVVSKFLPNVLTYRALQDLGIDNPDLSAALPELVKTGVARLIALQNSDGGWGWWSGEESNPNVSAYVVFGLLKARDAGFDVPSEMLGRGVEYLQTQSRDLDQRSASVYLDWQVWLNYVLAEAGMPNQAKIDALYKLRGNLSQYAQALLILSIGKADASDARLKTLFADLNGKVIQSATGAHWEESRIDWWAMNTDTRTTALVLNAIALYDKDNKLAPNVVRWLMVARKAGTGYWRSTQETAWALIALTDWMRATGELNANYAFGAQLNGATLVEAQASRATITQTTALTIPIASLLTDVGNRLTIAKGEGEGRLYYTAHLKTYQPVPEIKAADRGIVIQRRYVMASCIDGVKCPAVTEARVGDVLRVELTIIAPNDLHYLQVEDPLPAGGEAIDTTLATASQLDEGPGLTQNVVPGARRWWWYWGWWSRNELRDDRVALFATFLSKGTYTYTYTMRITSAGKFNVIPAFANLQYFPEVFGRSEGALLTVAR